METPMASISQTIRKAFNQATDQEQKDIQVVAETVRIWEYMTKSRQKWEYEAWLNDQFAQGEQNVAYDAMARRVVKTKTHSPIIINKIAQNERFVVAWLNRDHPQSKLLPGKPDPGAYIKTKNQEHLLDEWYTNLQLNRKTKQVSRDAFRYKFGLFKVIWDRDAKSRTSAYGDKNDKHYIGGELCVERVNPFDWYCDPLAHDEQDARFMGHAVPRTIDELKANPNYRNTELLTADNKLASSYIREAQMRSQVTGGSQFQPTGKDDSATLIVRELYRRTATGIRKTVTTATGILLEDRDWNMDQMPFVIYSADVMGDLLDGGSPVRNLRSPQKALNQLNSIIHENARVMGKINWRIPRGSNVNVIDDTVGQFIEFDPTPSGTPEQTQPVGLPAYMPAQVDRYEKYIDDLGGNHSASYGRSPGSKASGELVNKLQEGDSNNLALMRDNLDDALSRLCKLMLLTFKANATVDRSVRLKTPNALGEYQFIKVNPSDVSVEDDVVVRSGANMPYSLADKQEFLLNMKKENVIDAKTLIRALQMPDLDNLGPNQQMDITRAVEENQTLINGKQVHQPLKGEDHQVHLEMHTQLIKSELFLKANQKVQQAILDHYDAHIDMNFQLTQVSNSLNVEPIKRSEAIMYRPNNFAEMTPLEGTQIFGKFGIQSDRLQIQQRGGLNVQDPAAAEQQAMAEDMQMMDGIPVMISIADNHQVHIETHAKIMETAGWEQLPEPFKTTLTRHIKQHQTALHSQQMTPGLMSTPGYDNPNKHQILTNHAAMNPENPTPRPMHSYEAVQDKGAVDNQRASEQMAMQQAKEELQQRQATATPKAKPKKARRKT